MDCARFAEIVHDLERRGTEAHAVRQSALAHAEACERCGSLLEQVTSLDFALDALAAKNGDEQAPARLEAALLAEFRRRHAEKAQPLKSLRWVALATAAAVLLAFGASLKYWPGRAPSGDGSGAQKTDVAQVAPVAQTGAKPHAAKGPQENAVAGEDSEYATNFVPLPYADDPGTIEGGTVVRVTLSRAALASLGMPVADVSSRESIPADIALSEDGTPQAIRLVASGSVD